MIPDLNLTDTSSSLSDMAQPGAFAGQRRKAAAEEPLVDSSLMRSLGGERVDNRVNWASLYFCERYC